MEVLRLRDTLSGPMSHHSSPQRTRSRGAVVTAWAGGLLLLLLHLDFWRPQRPILHFGWLPEELLYRLSWLLLAWLYLMFFCSRIWTEEG